MGWFDFLSKPPSRDRFAQLVMQELRKLNSAVEMTYDPDQFLIDRGRDGIVNLTNLYAEYCQSPRAERQAVLQRFVHGCLGSIDFELPEDFADVHPDLLPVVRSRFYLESVRLQARVQGDKPFDVPQQLIGDNLSLSLVYDLPQAMRTIMQDDLDRWNVTVYEALEAARHNLEQTGEVAIASMTTKSGGSFYGSTTGDNYDASRLVLLDLIRRFPVRGDYIAMVPNRDSLLFTGSDDIEGLEAMCHFAEDSLDKPRPISTCALRLDGDEWESWLPDPSSPVYARFHGLRLRTLGAEYAEQKELLDAAHENDDDAPFVASFGANESKETGALRSHCVWSAGITTLLPETDHVILHQPADDGEFGDVVAAGDWKRVWEVAGELMQPTGMYPERYRVTEFPTAGQLARIGNKQFS